MRQNITERGRGGAYVPARVALQGRIRRSFPARNACVFGMETPLRGRSGGHAGTAPTVSFGQIGRGTVVVVWVRLRADGWFHLGELRVNGILFVWDAWKNMMEMGRGGADVPARVALQGRIRR